MSDPWLILLVVIVLGGAAYLYDRRTAVRQKLKLVDADRRRLSEDGVARTQARFEERLLGERSLSGGVRGRDLYIYRALMSGWYTQLSAANCHDTRKLEKVRADWLTYMELLQSQAAAGLLALKASDQSQRDAYAVEFAQIRLRRLAIEDGFAHAAGPGAIETLQDIRGKQFDDFSLDGRLAPDGYNFRH